VRFLVVFFCTLFLLPSPASADQYQDDQTSFARRQIADLQEAAEQGNAPVQYTVAHDYLYLKKYGEAAKWLRKAAEQGVGNAQMQLGKLYLDGNGVKQDYEEAYFWILLAPHYFNDEVDESFDPRDAGQHLTQEQRALVEKRVEDWKKAHPLPLAKPIPRPVPSTK
jgi:TPR repeat protein